MLTEAEQSKARRGRGWRSRSGAEAGQVLEATAAQAASQAIHEAVVTNWEDKITLSSDKAEKIVKDITKQHREKF